MTEKVKENTIRGVMAFALAFGGSGGVYGGVKLDDVLNKLTTIEATIAVDGAKLVELEGRIQALEKLHPRGG